jgi:hypothetical protein
MLSHLKNFPGYLAFGGVVLALYLWLEMTGVAFGGAKAPQKMDPTQIRSSSPGSWTYIYWSHGSRGK